MLEQVCIACHLVKKLEEFTNNRAILGGKDRRCKACNSKKSREWRLSHPGCHAAYQKLSYQKNKEHHRFKSWKRQGLSISIATYKEMLQQQNELCAICGTHQSDLKRNLAVDHNHKTGKIRGLLCMNCNRGIGLFHDDPEALEAAAQYLEQSCK